VAAEEQVHDVSGSESHSVEVMEQASDASASDAEPLPTAAYEQMATETTGIETAHEQILTATEGIIGARVAHICMPVNVKVVKLCRASTRNVFIAWRCLYNNIFSTHCQRISVLPAHPAFHSQAE